MTRSLVTRLKLLGCYILPNAGLVIKVLKRIRLKALTAAKRLDPEQKLLQFGIIKNLLKRKMFFSRTPKDLANLVIFCGNPEFYDQEILGMVLVEVFSSHRHFFRCYDMCAHILTTRETVCHYLSRCNKDFLKIGTVRFTEFLLDWLVKLLRLRTDLLGILDPGILQEILRRGTVDVYGRTFYELKFWEMENDEGVSPYLVVDFLYLCFFALYCVEIRRLEVCSLPSSNETLNIVDCIATIFRAVRRISLKLVFARAKVIHWYPNTESVIEKSVRWLCHSPVLPKFRERLGAEVPSLQHLCRCKVRNSLYKNWALPGGIYRLDLPKYLIGYLDLEYD